MRAIIFASIEQAHAHRRELDRAAGLPAVHAEVDAPGGYVIERPGNAARRIRERGVRTDHVTALLERPDGERFAVFDAGPGSEELDDSWSEPVRRP